MSRIVVIYSHIHHVLKRPLSTPPVRNPFTLPLDKIDKFTRNNAICLLGRMQIIIPQITVSNIIIGCTGRTACIYRAGDVVGCCSVEVERWVVVYVGYLLQSAWYQKSAGISLTSPWIS